MLLFTMVHAQKMNDKEASQLLNKGWNCLKTNDTTSFINFWSLNDSISIHHRRPHKKQEIIANFNAMKEWLDTAIQRKLNIEWVDITRQNLKGTDTKYWVQAWFKYDEHYYKGFGFYVAYMNKRWIVRDDASTSSMRK